MRLCCSCGLRFAEEAWTRRADAVVVSRGLVGRELPTGSGHELRTARGGALTACSHMSREVAFFASRLTFGPCADAAWLAE